MVMEVSQTYCGDHSALSTNTESSCCTPETHLMLYVNNVSSFQKHINIFHFVPLSTKAM